MIFYMLGINQATDDITAEFGIYFTGIGQYAGNSFP